MPMDAAPTTARTARRARLVIGGIVLPRARLGVGVYRRFGSGKCRSQPVSRILSAWATLRPRRRNDHSSRPVIAHWLRRPTRWLRTGRPVTPPYLVLLRAGFCLPPALPSARCALTAPFHPYPLPPLRASAGGMFSVPLSVKLPCPGVTRRTTLRSSDFPLPSALRGNRGYRKQRSSG